MFSRARPYLVLIAVATAALLIAAVREGYASGGASAVASASPPNAATAPSADRLAAGVTAAVPVVTTRPADDVLAATWIPDATAAATPAPAAPASAATPPPQRCPASWFCYPRLGVAGAIVPYSDCSGGTDVGTSIRAFLCLTPNYLMGHAYTQMGKITGWRAGDTVYAYGRAFTVYGALVEQSCQPPVMPLARLSMQTSLSPNTCGPVLVVQAQ